MSAVHDIYDPPPAPTPLSPPPPERPAISGRDVGILVGLGLVVLALGVWAWSVEPAMGVLSMLGGAIVITESWFTALGFLHRRPWMGDGGRWKIFLAALLPWLLGLGLAAALMIAVFLFSDWAG